MENSVVVACILQPINSYGMIDVDCEFNDGSVKRVFSYFKDELSFTSDELIGKTLLECVQLFRQKDIAYLQREK